MATNHDEEEERLRSVTLQNAQSILLARRRAEEALRKQSEWLRVTLSSIGDAVISTDTEGRVTFMNGVAESLTGWPQTEALGRPLPDVFHIIHEESRQPVENPVLRVLRDGVVIGLANYTVLIRKDGTELPIDDSAAPIRDERGEVVGCVLVFRDVCERRRAEASLQISEERFRSLVSAVTSIVWTGDEAGRFVTVQPSWAEYTGQTWEEYRDFGWANALHSDDRQRIRALREATRSARGGYQSEGRLWHAASHSYRHFEASAVPILNADGSLREWVGTCIDVEDRKRAETLLRCQKQALEMVVQGLPLPDVLDYLCRTIENESQEGVIACIHLLDDSASEFRYTAAPSLPESYARAVEAMPVSSATGPCCRAVSTRQTVVVSDVAADPQWAAFCRFALPLGLRACWSMPIFSRDQEVLGTFANYYRAPHDPNPRDQQLVEIVTRTVAVAIERKRAEEAQQKLTAELSEADRRKDEFLAMLAHELRNPLAPIRNALKILRLAPWNGKTRQPAMDMMERQVGQVVRLVDDLLDVSRISRGKIELRRGRIELASAVNHAVEASRAVYKSMNHELTVTLPPQPIYLNADPTRLAQVVGNLLDNACKFTDKGGHIWLTVEREDKQAVIRVRDSGIGIAADQLPRIFEMFTQADTSLERSRGGLGIGLSLVKNLVEMHDGTVEVHSAGVGGQGTEFVVRLPIMVETPKPLPPDPTVSEPSPTKPRRILVVDDNRDSATALAILLKLTGNQTHIAYDGLEAVEVAAAFKPDVVLLDIGLPKLNGYEAARKIREQTWGKNIAMVALTGWGQEEDRQKSRDAGFNAHMVKPVDLDALMKLLASLTPKEERQLTKR